MKVELVYESGCPNIQQTRENLLRAFSHAQLPARWTEWDIDSQDCPDPVRGFGSPTVLVNGNDTLGQARGKGSCCRLYLTSDGLQVGSPPVDAIRLALLGSGNTSNAGWRSNLAVLPGVGVALLPKLTCPMCWPAYSGILSMLGLSVLLSKEYLFAITFLFLSLSVGALGFRASHRHGYRPTVLGAAGSSLILLGKFRFESSPLMYCGLALLAAASLWNGWPRKAVSTCQQCVPAGGALQDWTQRRTNDDESRNAQG